MTPATMTDGSDAIPIDAASADNVAFQSMLTNLRLDNGAGSVAYDGRLAVAAQVHADDMLANDFFSHTGSDDSSVRDRARRAGYNWRAIGENLAQGYPDEASVLAGWVGSLSHQANNINPVFEDFALAQAGDGSARRWVLVLGAEQ